MWIVGDNYYGKVDHVPGLFFVKTRFLHIYWIPFVPRHSYLMWDDPANPYRGIRIPLCWRSVFKGWLWAYPFVALFALFGVFIGLGPERPNNKVVAWIILAGVVSAMVGLYWLVLRRARVTPARAAAVGQMLGIPTLVVEGFLKGDRDGGCGADGSATELST